MSREYYNTYWQHEAPPENDPLSPIRLSLFLNHIQQSRPQSILDIGCGDGALTDRIGKLGFNISGVDLSETAIRKAQTSFPHISFDLIRSNGTLPYAPGQFDAILRGK